jgi:hypothetical protein
MENIRKQGSKSKANQGVIPSIAFVIIEQAVRNSANSIDNFIKISLKSGGIFFANQQ